jgi:hypothetical protein
VASALGLAFRTTRGLAIAATAALTFIHPTVLIAVLFGLGVAIYLHNFRK